MQGSRAFALAVSAIALLMAAVAGAMTLRSATALQFAASGILLGASLLAALLLRRGLLLRYLRSPALPPGLRVVGGTFCFAVALITSLSERPPFLSFSQLHAVWLALGGCLLLAAVLVDWSLWRENRP